MTGDQLYKARKSPGLTQVEAAKLLGISQPGFSLFEKGSRRITDKLAKKTVCLFNPSPTALPLETQLEHLPSTTNKKFAKDLAALNYPANTYVKPSRAKNPDEIFLTALITDNLERRLVEALPWLLLKFSDMEWKTLVDAVKPRDMQNRLCFYDCRRPEDGGKIRRCGKSRRLQTP